MKHLTYIAILALLSGCAYEENPPPDQTIWAYDLPGNNGMSNEYLLALDSLITYRAFEAITGLVILKDDKLVFENYYRGASRHQSLPLGQGSLSLTWAATGIAIEQGLFELSSTIDRYLPSYDSLFSSNELKRQITVEDLLLHQTGLSWNESIYRLYKQPENDLNKMQATEDWLGFLLSKPMEAPPGLRTNYNSASGLILAKLIENTSGQDFEAYVSEYITSPINAGSLAVTTDTMGNYDGGNGIVTTLLDWMKFGYLIANDGTWKDRRVIDPNYVSASTDIQYSSGSLTRGYIWTIYEETILGEKVLFVADEYGQHLYIVPSLSLVVGISAENYLDLYNNSRRLFFSVYQSLISE